MLSTKPLPTIREAFSEVCREESRKKVMLGTSSTNQTADGSALMSRGTQQVSNEESAHAHAACGFQSFPKDNRGRQGRPWCDHCKKHGHTKETCWKIHGKPIDWKPSPRFSNDRDNRANLVSRNNSLPPQEQVPFNREQLDFLQN